MSPRFSRFAVVAGLVSIFWVVPSLRSHGEGASRDRIIHVDAALLADSAATGLALQRADQATIRAVSAL